MKKLIRYGCWFCATVILCLSLLCAAAYAPQDAVDRNVAESAKMLMDEPLYPRVGDKSYGSRLDNFTDAQIVMQCKSMTSEQLDSVLTNPRFVYDGKNPVESLYDYVHDDNPVPYMYYTRYWMGFRAIVRWLLTFLNYYQIKRYLAFALFTLFAAVFSSVTNRLGTRHAMALAVSIFLIRPYVVCQSLQFSTCFLIAFTGILLIPWVERNPKYEGLFFMELGMFTMFFDFYTTPIITFGLPMIYLYLLRMNRGEGNQVSRILKNAALWFVAYGAMWISKMFLTEVFTSAQGWYSGYISVATWFGIGEFRSETAMYSPWEAFSKVLLSVTSDSDGQMILQIALVVLAIWLTVMLLLKKVSRENCRQGAGLLLMAVLPLIWFAVSAEPTRIHYWFQYRSLVMTWWALGAYLCAATCTGKIKGKYEK